MLGHDHDLADLLALAGGPAEQSAKRPRSSSVRTTVTGRDLTIEPLSGIRIRPESRKLDQEALQALSSTFDFRPLNEIPRLLRAAVMPATWLTIGVLVDKGPTKSTHGGNQFCVWRLSDLKRSSMATNVSLFLFGEACSAAWKELPGTAFALINAKAVPRKDGAGAGADEGALSIDKLQQLQRIGHASEFAFCKAERRDGKPCTMWINKEECEYCDYHVGAALRQANRTAAAPKRQLKEAPLPSSQGASSSAAVVTWGRSGGVTSEARAPQPSGSSISTQQRHPEPDIVRAVQILRESGFTFQPPDPNSSDPFKNQFKEPKVAVAPRRASAAPAANTTPSASALKSHVAAASNVLGAPGRGVSCRASGNTDMASSGCSFLQAFGSIDQHAKEQVLQAKPVGAASEREASRAELDRHLGTLSKKEQLHEKVRASQHLSDCTQRAARATEPRTICLLSNPACPIVTGPNGISRRGDGLQVPPLRLFCRKGAP